MNNNNDIVQKEGNYDDIEYQADLAKYSLNGGIAACAGFGMFLSSVSALIAMATIGKVDSVEKWQQFGSLAYITSVLLVAGVAIITPSALHYPKKINEACDKRRRAREFEEGSGPIQSSSP